MKFSFATMLNLVIFLAGCVSLPSTPYWQDPHWVNELGKTLQANIRYPNSVIRDTPTDKNFPAGTAVVRFTYDNGKLMSVRVVKSTGHKALDDAIAKEIPDIRPPLAPGIFSTKPAPLSVYSQYRRVR